MAIVSISFSGLGDACDKARKLGTELYSYAYALDGAVPKPLEKLPGSDDAGHISTASSLAIAKSSRLRAGGGSFFVLGQRLTEFQQLVEKNDRAVASSIESEVKLICGERAWYQKTGDLVYGQYVKITRNLSELFPVISDLKVIWALIGNAAARVSDWFRYGNGKYVLNVLNSGVEVIATASTVIGIAGMMASLGPVLAFIALVGVAVGSVALVAKSGDFAATANANQKAWELAYDKSAGEYGNIVSARYYGDTEGVSDSIRKTDFGGKSENEAYERIGLLYDKVRDTAEFIAETVEMALGITVFVKKLGNVYNQTGGVVGRQYSRENVMKNFRNEFRYKLGRSGVDYTTDASGRRIARSNFNRGFRLALPDDDATGVKAFKLIKKTSDTIKGYYTVKDMTMGNYDAKLDGPLSNAEKLDKGIKSGMDLANLYVFMKENPISVAVTKTAKIVDAYIDYKTNSAEHAKREREIYNLYNAGVVPQW